MAAEVNGSISPATAAQEVKQEDVPMDDLEADAEHEVDDASGAKPKKKRRVIKATDKKYECPHHDCGKAYSRAEHLYRHQLNRTSPPGEA